MIQLVTIVIYWWGESRIYLEAQIQDQKTFEDGPIIHLTQQLNFLTEKKKWSCYFFLLQFLSFMH